MCPGTSTFTELFNLYGKKYKIYCFRYAYVVSQMSSVYYTVSSCQSANIQTVYMAFERGWCTQQQQKLLGWP